MDSFEINKMAGAVLGTALFAFGLSNLSGIIYHAETPEKPGFAIAVAEASAGGEAAGGEEAGGAEQEQEQEQVTLGTLLASADVARGQAVAKACMTCHDLTQGGPNKTGPNLWAIVGRNHAVHEGFNYSDALKALSSEPWSYEALDAFLKAPKEAIPNNKMAYGGVKRDADRASLIAYLATLSDSPLPFPAP